MSSKKNISINQDKLWAAILTMVLGVLFLAFRSGMLNILFTVVGVVLILVGIITLFNKQWANGIIYTVVGIVVITCGWTIVDIALLIIGIVAIGYAIYMVISDFNKYKTLKGMPLANAILAPLCLLVVGILLITSKWVLSDAIFIVLGIIMILDGVFMLLKK